MIITFLLIFVAVLAVFYLDKRKRNIASISKIPGPPPKPFIGNALDFGTNTIDILINLKQLAKQYGPIVKLWVGSRLYILLTGPKYISQITNGDDAVKSTMYRYLIPVIGDGLISSSGEKWQMQRRLLAPYFSNKAVKQFVPVFNKNANNLVQKLKTLATMEPVDIMEHVNICTLAIICNTTMNADLSINTEFLQAVTFLLENTVRRMFSFWKQFDRIYKLTDDYKEEQIHLEVLNSHTKSIIANRKKQRLAEDKEGKPNTFLDSLLDVAEQNGSFADSDIHDQVKTFVIAGYDTIAAAVNFGLFELAKRPDIQNKMVAEIISTIGKERNVDLTFENVADLKYTDCVFKEILRKYPSAGILERELIKNVDFDGHIVPKGTTIMLFIKGCHNMERNFSDPEEFLPERFLPENAKNIPQQAYIPFLDGPRICIGDKFALTEAKLLLAKIVQNFELFEVQPEHKPILSMGTVTTSANGLPIKLKIR